MNFRPVLKYSNHSISWKDITMTQYSDWMAANAEAMGPFTLRDFAIPGSHDAGSLGARWGLIFGKEAAEAQDRSIYQQLLAGSRYLDLRVWWRDGDYYFYHGDAVTKTRLFDVVDDISLFALQYPKEFIIITIRIVDGESEKAYLKFRHALGPAIVRTGSLKGSRWPRAKIQDIQSQSQRIFVQGWFGNRGDTDNLCRKGIYEEKNTDFLMIFNELKKQAAGMPKDGLWIWHIAPPYSFWKDAPLGFSLESNARIFNYPFFNEKLSSGELLKYNLSIVNCDFIGELDWVGACLRHNKHRLNQLTGKKPNAPGQFALE